MKFKATILLATWITISSSCRKATDSPSPDRLPGTALQKSVASGSVAISRVDFDQLKAAHQNNDQKAVDSLWSHFRTRRSTTAQTVSSISRTMVVDENEIDGIAAYGDATDYFYDPVSDWNNFYDYDAYGVKRDVLMATVNMEGHFAKRGNLMKVRFPFSYYADGGAFVKPQIEYGQFAEPKIWVIGNKLGDFNSSIYLTRNIGSGVPGFQNPTPGTSEGATLEERTVMLSANGSMKLTSSINGAIIEVGTEIEAGFVVSSKYNTTSTFEYFADFSITVNPFPARPTITYNFAGICRGIQIN